jgi:ferredoxin-type protein NapG
MHSGLPHRIPGLHKAVVSAGARRRRTGRQTCFVGQGKDPEPTLNLKERMGVARLVRPESCLAVQGKGFKGQTRGPTFKGRMRYMSVDRWKPIPIADHPYDVPECNLCVSECPVKGAISIETLIGSDGKTSQQPMVHEPCVGCGVCEMVCPTEQACIVIEAREEWKA